MFDFSSPIILWKLVEQSLQMCLDTHFNAKYISTVWQESNFANEVFHVDTSLRQSLQSVQFFIKVDRRHLETAEAN